MPAIPHSTSTIKDLPLEGAASPARALGTGIPTAQKDDASADVPSSPASILPSTAVQSSTPAGKLTEQNTKLPTASQSQKSYLTHVTSGTEIIGRSRCKFFSTESTCHLGGSTRIQKGLPGF